MKTVAILGASGRIGHEVAAMFARQDQDCRLLGTYYNHDFPLPGVSMRRVNMVDDRDMIRLCHSCDVGIDCTGPSVRLGERVSEVFFHTGVPLISLGHTYSLETKGQTFQAGALPGILAGAFLLLDEDCSTREVFYEFAGGLTPTASIDVLEASACAKPPSDGRLTPRSAIIAAEETLPYEDEALRLLSERSGISVQAFSVWPEAIRQAFGSASGMDMERGACVVSASSNSGGLASLPTRIHLVGNSGTSDRRGKVITIPSLYELSAASAWLAFDHSLYECQNATLPFAILQASNPERYIREAVFLVGGLIETLPEWESEVGPQCEEGTI